jgi:hypothetical protein
MKARMKAATTAGASHGTIMTAPGMAKVRVPAATVSMTKTTPWVIVVVKRTQSEKAKAAKVGHCQARWNA